MKKLIETVMSIKGHDDIQEFDTTEFSGYLAAVMTEEERHVCYFGGLDHWQAHRLMLLEVTVRLYERIGECIGKAQAQMSEEQIERIRDGKSINDFIDMNGILVEKFADDSNEYVNLDFYNFVMVEIHRII